MLLKRTAGAAAPARQQQPQRQQPQRQQPRPPPPARPVAARSPLSPRRPPLLLAAAAAAAAAASVPFPDDNASSSNNNSSSSSSSSPAASSSSGRDIGAGVYVGLRPPPSALGLLAARLRAVLFAAWTFALAVPLFVVMVAMSPLVLLTDKSRRLAQHFVNNLWACASTAPFFRVTVEGAEHLPKNAAAAVYVANHASFVDIFSLFHLMRSFKFVSKTSNFLIPVVGWSMFLTGHVMINRVDRRSQIKCLAQCVDLLGAGASCLFFPEGTRSKDGRMHAFKRGAFSVAAKAGVPVVPVTLLGTAGVMPNGREGEMYGGAVRIVVHPPVPPPAAGEKADAGAMADAARRAVASALPADLVAAADDEAPDE
jgi:1-acyl-sn-glycerol-3-phosphate acyltransferase